MSRISASSLFLIMLPMFSSTIPGDHVVKSRGKSPYILNLNITWRLVMGNASAAWRRYTDSQCVSEETPHVPWSSQDLVLLNGWTLVSLVSGVFCPVTNCTSCIWLWQVRASSYNSNKLTNQMQQFYKFIAWRFVSLTMFRAPPSPSSEAYNCINSLWFYLGT